MERKGGHVKGERRVKGKRHVEGERHVKGERRDLLGLTVAKNVLEGEKEGMHGQEGAHGKRSRMDKQERGCLLGLFCGWPREGAPEHPWKATRTPMEGEAKRLRMGRRGGIPTVDG